ncbi:KxYKxGKxW signal peptide domain-containing protein [Levilactobacillus humaensis]|uniref:KxYKxGKxW signal peptide domain-containing protein n=1 Tax=Levilactobacillus humaensis TaxID=2950375 RepID=UPI0021C4AE50|nr:KxYKxGKxW signal peptide domain-containing protein [Levilactobacillus humaensis]
MPNGTKQHYKMYKAKKQWLVVGLTAMALGAGMAVETTAQAATPTSAASESTSGNAAAPSSAASGTESETPSSANSEAGEKAAQSSSAASGESQAAPASSLAGQKKGSAAQPENSVAQPAGATADSADVPADSLKDSVVTLPVHKYQVNDLKMLGRSKMSYSGPDAARPAARMVALADDTPATTTDSDFIISDNIITGYKGTATAITIPAKVNGEDVYGRLQELSEHLLEPHLFPEDL